MLVLDGGSSSAHKYEQVDNWVDTTVKYDRMGMTTDSG